MSEFEESITWYELRWKHVLINLLDFDAASAESWIAASRCDAEGNSMFFHESPMWYLSPLLLPVDLRRRMPAPELILACGQLDLILTQNTEGSGFPNGVGWNALRQRLANEVETLQTKYAV